MTGKPPKFKMMTALYTEKMYFRTIPERSLQPMVDSSLRPLSAEPRFVSKGQWVGTYAMPSGSVLEIYAQEKKQTGFLFLTLDGWLSYPDRLTID